MSRVKKFAVVILLLVPLLVFAVLFQRHMRARAAQAREEAAHREALALAPFQRDLHAGMSRAQVQRYLESRSITYAPMNDGSDAWSYDLPMGEEPGDGFVCDRWNVYVALNFTPSSKRIPESEPLSTDILQEIKIKKIGHCL